MTQQAPSNDPARARPPKRHVAILGAGPAGLAAAFALSRTSALRERYDVTIYQAGWRAGGKSATGRATYSGYRIEQNGSHYLFGCYGNAFALVREAYEVLDEKGDLGFGTYRDQFVPRTLIVGKKDGEANWSMYLPETPEWPDQGTLYPKPSHYVLMGGQWVVFIVLWTVFRLGDPVKAGPRAAGVMAACFPMSPFNTGPWAPVMYRSARAVAFVIDLSLWPTLRIVGFVLGVVSHVLGWLRLRPGRQRGTAPLLSLVSGLVIAVFETGRSVMNHEPLKRLRRTRIFFDLVTTAAIGFFKERLWEPGNYEAADGKDFRDWLKDNGASTEVVESSLVKCWYDGVVAYLDGNKDNPSISAAVSLHALGRAFGCYKGAVAYQMAHEIGDAMIGPIAKALQWRGVKFKYFHRVVDIAFDSRTRRVTKIEMELQDTPEHRAAYEKGASVDKSPDEMQKISLPFVPMPIDPPRSVWPNQPVFDPGADLTKLPPAELTQSDSELFPVKGPRITIDLAAGPEASEGEFHEVVYALPLDATRSFAALSQEPGWQESLAEVKSAASQSMRLWGSKSLSKLGWAGPPPILSGFASPYSTWEDNQQNVGHELFAPAGLDEPLMIATLFGPLQQPPGQLPSDLPPYGAGAGPGIQAQYLKYFRQVAQDFYAQRAQELWPDIGADPFASLISDDKTATGSKRFDWQFATVNIGSWARYTLAAPGTLAARIRPDETGFRNMVAAGEWTHNSFEVGCVEGAVISGLVAAQAISGSPSGIVGQEEMTFGALTSATVRLSRPRLA